MIWETRRKKRRISNESNYAGKPSTRHFFPLVRNDEDLAVTHDTRRLDRPHSNDPASLLHASLRFHGTKANRAVTRFERNFRIYSLTKRLSGTHNWTREKKKKRRGEVKRDETRRGTTRQGKARQGEARWKKVNGATSATREKNIQPTRVPARRRLNTTPVARYEWEVCLACTTERDRAILSRWRRDEESVKETKNSFHRVRSRQAKGWATDRRKP